MCRQRLLLVWGLVSGRSSPPPPPKAWEQTPMAVSVRGGCLLSRQCPPHRSHCRRHPREVVLCSWWMLQSWWFCR